jgi:hypothetical protein
MGNKENKTEVDNETIEIQLIEDEYDEIDVELLLPTMNMQKEFVPPPPVECIIEDEVLVDLYGEILNNCREDRVKADEIMTNFLDMATNDGDSSSATKEAVVGLMKIKTDMSDKMSKVADLMTRIKLKDKDTFPRYLAQQQNNKVVIEGSHRDLLKSINKLSNKKVKPNDA